MNFKKKNIAILGSTGSVGENALKVISKYPNYFNVKLLVCNKSYKKIIYQIIKYSPKYVFIKNFKVFTLVKKKFHKENIIFFNTLEYMNKIFKSSKKFDKVLIGISGLAGLDYSFSFLNYSKELLIANKESLICGGKVLLKNAKLKKCKIISVDSEHYSLSEILKNENLENIDKIYITASGGPLLNKKNKSSKKIQIKDVLKHPTWSMGKKISIDSATMVNKIFELIEAHLLFSIPYDKLRIKIHKESLVHSAIVLKNGLVKMIMHNTSMQIPIRNSFFDNNFFNDNKNYFKEISNFTLNFDEINLKNFNITKIGSNILKGGHAKWIFFNVINDFLVYKFLNNEIFFYEIVSKLIKVFKNRNIIKDINKKIKNFSDIKNMIILSKKIASNL